MLIPENNVNHTLCIQLILFLHGSDFSVSSSLPSNIYIIIAENKSFLNCGFVVHLHGSQV